MKIGYARISTPEQNLDAQTDQLKVYGCEKIFTDIASGVKEKRSGLDNVIQFARTNDEVVVVRLDRLGRSMKELINLITFFEAGKIGFVSLSENISTNSSTGKLIFHIFGALADFERNLIIERTKAGLAAARARGRCGGRAKSLKPKDVELMLTLHNSKSFSVSEIAEQFNISRITVYNYIHRKKQQLENEYKKNTAPMLF